MNLPSYENAFPSRIQLENDQLLIEWDDGKSQSISARKLRDNCPCATCREKSSAPPSLLPVLDAKEVGSIRIIQVKPVGNYAYGIQFSDGHETGVFTLQYLYSHPGFN